MEVRVATGLDARFDRVGATLTVALSGEVDSVSVEPLAILLGREEAAEMVIDLADVIFVDLAGARGLVMSKVSFEGRGSEVRIAGASAKVIRTFEAAGLAGHLDG